MGSSGKSGGAGSGSKDYYGDIGAVLCIGPVDAIMSIIIDSKEVWTGGPGGLQRAGQPNPVQITVEGYGTAWFYWGEADQVLDPVGEKLLSDGGHPPYRNQALIVLKSFLFGRERVSAPNLEVVVRRKPRQNIVTGAAALLDADGQANPIAVVAEILTNPVFGLGLPDSFIEASSWQAAADALLANASLTYISPALTSPKTARTLLDELREYYDGWFRFNPAGKITAGRWSHGEAPPTWDAGNTLTAADLTEEPSIDTASWAETSNEVNVKFVDAGSAWKDGALTVQSGYNRELTGEPRQLNIERPHITRPDQAAALGAEHLKIVETPKFSGTLKVRGVKAAALPPGSLFKLTHDLLGLDFIARVVQRRLAAPPSETGTIDFEAERALSVVHAPTAATAGIYDAPAATERITAKFFQPPASLLGDNYLLVILARRLEPLTSGLRLWFQQEDVTLFQDLGAQFNWAVNGQLAAPYSSALGDPDDDSEAFAITWPVRPLDSDLDIISEAQTADMIADDFLLAFVFSASDPKRFEILTVRELRFDGGTVYAKVRRGRFSTSALDFVAGDQVWVIRRDFITSHTHAQFPALSRAQNTGVFRLQSLSSFGVGDLTNPDECPDIPYVFREVFPKDVTDFTIEANRLTWVPVADSYIAGYRIRYHQGERTSWTDAVELHTGLLTDSPYQSDELPSGPVTFLLKAVDTSGSESQNPATIVTDLGDPAVANVIETIDLEALGWPGIITGGSVGVDGLEANSITLMWSANTSLPMWAADSSALMWPPATYGAMTYLASVTIPANYSPSTLTISSEIIGTPWTLYWRKPLTTPMWSSDDTKLLWGTVDTVPLWNFAAWQPWPGSAVVSGETQLDFLISTGEAPLKGEVKEFVLNFDVPDVTETLQNVTISAAGTRLPITQTYRAIKGVQLTVQADGNGAITVRIEDKNPANGPLVKCFNAAGVAVDGLIDALVQGY